MVRLKMLSAGVLALLATLVILQNIEPVEASLLFWRFSLPLAILLLTALLAGIAIGLLTALLWERKWRKRTE